MGYILDSTPRGYQGAYSSKPPAQSSVVANITYSIVGNELTVSGNESIGTVTFAGWNITGPEDATGPDGSLWPTAPLSGPDPANFDSVLPPGGWQVSLEVSDGVANDTDILHLLWTTLELTGTKVEQAMPDAPVISNGTALSQTEIRVHVAVPSNANVVALYVNPGVHPALDPPTQIIPVFNTGNVTISGLTGDSPYYINGHSSVAGKTSADSSGVQLSTPPGPPDAPINLVLGPWSYISGNSYTITADWEEPLSGQEVTSYVVNGTNTGNLATIAELTIDANTEVSVASRGAGGDSSAITATFTPEPGPPTGGDITIDNDNGDGTYNITISWTAPSYGGTLTGYKVNGDPNVSTSISLLSVTPPITYSIVATNGTGDSSSLDLEFNP